MKIRRYVATSLREAVVQIKRELGADALILEVRRVRAPGIWGFFKPRRVEVTAASSEEPNGGPTLKPQPLVQQPQLTVPASVQAVERPTAGESVSNDQLPERLRRSYALVQEEVQFLARRGVELELARELVNQAFAAIPEDKLTNRQALSEALTREVLSLFPEPALEPFEGRIVAFIGPTGVGKTTTIAKLAANYSLQKGKQVALITADTYRIAAVDQLKRYAEILNLPLEVIFTPADLPAAIARHASADMILIDTAGRSPHQGMHLAELRDLIRQCPGVSRVLVVSATTKADDLVEIYTRFSMLRPDQLVFTKLDETKTAGSLLSLVKRARIPVSYVTFGQNVPDDLEMVTPKRLVEMILGGNSYAGPGGTTA